MKKVMQLFTRLATMFLAVMCVLGMGTPVMASNVIPESGTFTISGLDKSAEAEGITVNAYQIISVNVDSSNQAANPLYIWDSDVASWMGETYKSYINEVDSVSYVSDEFKKQVTEGVTTSGVSQQDATKFYEELAAEIRKEDGSSISITPTIKVRDNFANDGSVKFENMKPGVYLITITGGIKTYQPTVVTLVPTYSEENGEWTITPAVGIGDNTTVKSANPAITKTVTENETVAVGDVVKYKLDVTTPDYPINSVNRTFTVEDTMPDGIVYDFDTGVTVQYEKGQQKTTIPATSVDNDKTYYTVTDVVENTPAKGFKITFTDDYFAEYGAVRNLTITYQGTVVQAAFEANPDKLENTATLTYNSDPYNVDGKLKTASASARVYSYRLQINKVDKEGNPLAGAQFEIYTKTGNEVSDNPLKFTGDKGSYILASSSEETTVTKLQVSVITGEETKTGGNLLIKGLDVGTYVIKEVTAPEGYVLPDGQMEVTITDADTPDGSIDTVTHSETGSFKLYTANDTDAEPNKDGVYITNTDAAKDIPNTTFNNTVTIDVLNTSNADAEFELPSTGGMGTLIFTVGGLFVMAGAVVLAVMMYKKRNA